MKTRETQHRAANGAAFERIGLVGAGLIGGSIAARAARALPGVDLLVHDMSRGNAAYVAERHPRGRVIGELAQLADCDAIFLCTPVSVIADLAARLLALPASDAVVIDTGSAKLAIVEAVARTGVDAGRFVPGHPLAGGVSTGPGLASADIFTARPFVLTPSDATDAAALAAARALIERLGASVVEMDAAEHDRLLAIGSHLPHLIAFALAGLGDSESRELLPASFRGIAAFAGSDPQMWTDIFSANARELSAAAEIFKKRLDLIAAMADEPAPGALLEILNEAKARIEALEERP